MSPSLPVNRPVWVWSLPAFAILLSFLWYRKKRGSLKTDSGGAVEETHNDPISDNNTEVEIPAEDIISETEESVLVEEVEENQVEVVEVIEKIVDQAKVDIPVEKEVEKVEVTEQMVVAAAAPVAAAAAAETPKEEQELSRIVEDETPKGKSKCKKNKKLKEMAKKSNETSLDKRQHNDEDTATILEKKLAKLDLAKQCSNDGTDEKQANEDEAERDSANNSPSEVMLASPSVSGYSDTHSEVNFFFFFKESSSNL